MYHYNKQWFWCIITISNGSSAFEQGNLDLQRYRNAFIIIIILLQWCHCLTTSNSGIITFNSYINVSYCVIVSLVQSNHYSYCLFLSSWFVGQNSSE